MKTLFNYISEKLTINKNAESSIFDSLMKAVMYAKRKHNQTDLKYFIYKTKDSLYGVEENIDDKKVGDTVNTDATVVELVPKK